MSIVFGIIGTGLVLTALGTFLSGHTFPAVVMLVGGAICLGVAASREP